MKPTIANIDYEKMLTKEGTVLWESASECLNEIIRQSGQIQIDNRTIWDTILHEWTNEEWAKVLWVLETLMQTNPEWFHSFHEDAVLKAKITLEKDWNTHARTLDTKKNKKIAWKLLMTMREIYNKAADIHLPNADSSRDKTKITTELFEIS